MSGARLFDLGYRSYDGPRRRPAYAILTLGIFTGKRVLGLGRGARAKVLPAITIFAAFSPAVGSVVFAALASNVGPTDLFTYADYTVITATVIALFAALVAPEALCPDRRSGMFGLYLAGPLDRNRYLVSKAGAVFTVMLLITAAPMVFMLLAYFVAGLGPGFGESISTLGRILLTGVAIAALYASLALAASSFTTRRAAAAVGVILVVLIPPLVVESLINNTDAPEWLSLLSFVSLGYEIPYRIFGEDDSGNGPVSTLTTLAVTLGACAWIFAGALITWLRYRRLEASK